MYFKNISQGYNETFINAAPQYLATPSDPATAAGGFAGQCAADAQSRNNYGTKPQLRPVTRNTQGFQRPAAKPAGPAVVDA